MSCSLNIINIGDLHVFVNCLIGIVKGCIGCIYRNQQFPRENMRANKKFIKED